MTQQREHWKSRLGFIWAAVGSAVGLGSIWRFPYVVGENGGAGFVLIYLICLALVGFPVLISEIVIGRKAQKSPSGAFAQLGKSKSWRLIGRTTIITGFLVSSFYGVIAGVTLGYLLQALFGRLIHFHSASDALETYTALTSSSIWILSFFLAFMAAAVVILFTGVRRGIERANTILMPLLFILLLGLAIQGLFMEGSAAGLSFLFSPNWSEVNGKTIAMALGQAFFALSLGQGTMITYGSYLSRKENILTTCFPVALFGTIVSLLAGMAIFPIVFSVGMEPSSGTGLMFQTLPVVFSKVSGGYILSVVFFLLVFLAGITSQISAMEPMISFLMDEKKFDRHKAVWITAISGFLLGIPSALSFGLIKNAKLFGENFFTLISNLCVNILIPLGGLAAVILIGWRWGLPNTLSHLREGSQSLFERMPFIKTYLKWGIKYLAPAIILFILIDLLGII